MKCLASTIVSAALSEVGYCEKNTDKKLEETIGDAGDGNFTKYAAYIDTNFPSFYNGRKQGFAWCDVFVDYLFLKCFGYENALRLLCQPEKSAGAGCTYSRAFYQAAGRLSEKPEVGAQIFFYDKNNRKRIAHTGIVISFDTTSVYTVEGNTSNKVGKRSYKLTDDSIAGYGVPAYDSETDLADVDTVAKQVIAGVWGNGEERKTRLTLAGYSYEEVQAVVNALMNAQSTDGKAKEIYIPKTVEKLIIHIQ